MPTAALLKSTVKRQFEAGKGICEMNSIEKGECLCLQKVSIDQEAIKMKTNCMRRQLGVEPGTQFPPAVSAIELNEIAP